jgi:ABC-type multidrug transport system ATPase subunit
MLEIRGLVKVYPGPVAALQGIDLEFSEGMFGLLGPNGAGKSTLMQIVAGILEPTSGDVLLDGVAITEDPAHVWERLGYLPQDFGFYGHLTGRAMLAHLLRLKGVRAPGGLRKLCDELLERVNLTDAARRKVKGYSGGMVQRLGIAQAIAGDPRILVVDEPTAGLDPEERQRFYRVLAELARERIVLLSTHIVEDVSVLCSSFAIIREGRLVARTTPRAAREAVAGKIFEGAVEPGALDALQESFTVIQERLSEAGTRVRVLQAEGEPPPGFEPVEATLEDAYLGVMRVGAGLLPEVRHGALA